MKHLHKAGIICCSNGFAANGGQELQQLKDVLQKNGISPVCSNSIFAKEGIRSGTAKERANALMEFYRDPEIDAIFDISGGDIANEILPYLDYEEIAGAKNRAGQSKQFWGYSDLTVILNAIYAKTGNSGVLYQVRHLIKNDNTNGLFSFSYSFTQGKELSGIVAGGNIRCLLKLAGTEYFPDFTDKILFLEARSGLQSQMITYLSQLKQLGVFTKVKGILLGTFTQMEQEQRKAQLGQLKTEGEIYKKPVTMEELVKEFAGDSLSIVKTSEIGHAMDSKAIVIGKHIKLMSGKNQYY